METEGKEGSIFNKMKRKLKDNPGKKAGRGSKWKIRVRNVRKNGRERH